jgi:hypothetical protein
MAMNEPPTLLVRETDDDRTLIDPIRLRDPNPPFAGSVEQPRRPSQFRPSMGSAAGSGHAGRGCARGSPAPGAGRSIPR